MRVALTITELHPGGAEKCLVNLACYLHRQGHEVRVWQLWPAPPREKCILTDVLDSSNIVWRSGDARHSWEFPRVVRWLRSELNAFQPDVVQAFLFHANLATSIAGRGLPATIFGGVRVRQPQRVRWWLQRWAARRFKKVICVSRMVAEHCRDRERIPAEKLVVIPNGIDPTLQFNQVSWQQFGLPVETPVILFVGRLDEQKGIREFLEHVDVLLTQLPKHHCVLMGAGPLQSQLQRRIAGLSAFQRVHLLGWQSNAIDWMRRAQMLVLPARYEGMPNVVLEAMAAGIPVVAFDVDGVRELIPDSKVQVVPAGDFSKMIEALTRLAKDPELRRQCAAYNRQRVSDHFSLERQLAEYETLYLKREKGS